MRNSKGHWLPGTSGNPGGRPKGESEYLGILKKMLTPAKFRAIVKKAIEDATDGDRHARTWLSDYAMGKPIQTVITEEHPAEALGDELQRALERISERRVEDGESGEPD